MNDPRCCGSDACLINAAGECWCGQKWDGDKMCTKLGENVASKETDEQTHKTEKHVGISKAPPQSK
ncbi:MAG: hypothetical protein RL020_698 [Pseudomonadota bacterium]|jgi:hypothetical protein